MNSLEKEIVELNFRVQLLTDCVAQLFEKVLENDGDYKSRSYELLLSDFSADEVNELDKFLVTCVMNKKVMTKTELRKKFIEIRRGRNFTEYQITKLLEAYKYEKLFLPVIDTILSNRN